MKALLCEFYGLSWTNKRIDTRPLGCLSESLIFLLLLLFHSFNARINSIKYHRVYPNYTEFSLISQLNFIDAKK